MQRDPSGPFQQHRDWQFIGLGTRKVRWNKEQAIQSLWNHKRQPSAEVETFSRDGSPRRRFGGHPDDCDTTAPRLVAR